MNFFANFLFENITVTLFICLGFGYLLGKAKIKTFVLGSTAGTLIIGFLVGLYINFFASPELISAAGGQSLVNGPLSSMFFALFCFTIGFEVGPSFFSSLKTTGIQIVGLAVFFDVVVLISTVLICKLFGFDAGTGVGLIAGAITQSAVLGTATKDAAANATVAYALTYIFGTIGVIFYVKKIAPLLLRKDLFHIAKERIDCATSLNRFYDESSPEYMIQVRAYKLLPKSNYHNCTVYEAEERFVGNVEIEAVYRSGVCIRDFENLKLRTHDVIQVVGNVRALDLSDNYGLEEVSEKQYFQVKLVNCEIVLTEDFTENGHKMLSEKGILVKGDINKNTFKKHSIISVTGSAKAIENAALEMGYIKNNGTVTDISFMSMIISVGLVVGAIKISSFSLGSAAVLIMGMAAGWWYEGRPKVGNIPAATRWILKSLGLNLYIAATALNVSDKLMGALTSMGLRLFVIIFAGIILTLIPHILSLLFGKYVMHIYDADIIGGLCGCGTCAAALDGVNEETGSNVFAIAYAPGCATSNILLILVGILLPMFV